MMKQVACLIVALLLTAYSRAQSPGTVIYKGAPGAGTISVSATGLGNNKELSIKDGISNAFYALLFRGIPGSQYELPMVPDENEKKNNRVVKDLLDGGYSTFLVAATLTDDGKKKKKRDGMKGIMTSNFITINCDALRRYLEQNNVIRKFGI
jgi:hypothetical protein